MAFTSPSFLAFFAVFYLLFLTATSSLKLRNVLLVAGSLMFYSVSNWLYTFILLAVIIIDYFLSHAIHNEQIDSRRKLMCFFSILFNLSLLVVFKLTILRVFVWSAFPFIQQVADESTISSIVIPLGISFYTFESMSYIIDVYRREVKPAKNILDYALFISFFPHLFAGPIIRAKKFLPQAGTLTFIADEDFWSGINRFFVGCLKKVLVADPLGLIIVDHVFKYPNQYSQLELLITAYAYALQVYFDFSAYSDMALGLSKVFGFSLPENFNSPYAASSIKEYWRRWHISLSSWLKDYVYIPLGGSRRGKFRHYFNIIFTMFLGGIWHGQTLSFVLWGCFHGVIVTLNHFFDEKKWLPTLPKFAGWLITFNLVVIGRIIYRSESTEKIREYFYGLLFSATKVEFNSLFYVKVALLAVASVITILGSYNYKSKTIDFLTKQKFNFKIAFVALSIMLTLAMTYQFKPFIYFYF